MATATLKNETNESRIGICDRLRAAGCWDQAAAWKDRRIKQLREQGLSRLDATEQAWQELGKCLPPDLLALWRRSRHYDREDREDRAAMLEAGGIFPEGSSLMAAVYRVLADCVQPANEGDEESDE